MRRGNWWLQRQSRRQHALTETNRLVKELWKFGFRVSGYLASNIQKNWPKHASLLRKHYLIKAGRLQKLLEHGLTDFCSCQRLAISCCELETVICSFLLTLVYEFSSWNSFGVEVCVGLCYFSYLNVLKNVNMNSFSIDCSQMFHERFIHIQSRRWMHVKACACLLAIQTVYLLSFV